MAAPLFSSYSWRDWIDEVEVFDRMLYLRGVPVYRDRAEMRWGNGLELQLLEAMLERCSGYALYATETALASLFVTQVELPAMHRRRLADRSFFAGAVFRDYDPVVGGAAIYAASGVNLGTALGTKLDRDLDLETQLAGSARQILRAYLRSQWNVGPATARIETRNGIPNADPSLLHLIWSPPLAHDVDSYDRLCWDGQLLPALADLRKELEWALGEQSEREQVLRVTGAAHLSAALALGYEFRESTHWNLLFESRGERWPTARGERDLCGWEIAAEPGPPNATDLVVCVNIARDVADAVRDHRRIVGPARAELHLRHPNGEERTALEPSDGNRLAGALAEAVGRAMNTYRTTETHLFLACPWPFAALLGWHLARSGAVVSHELALDNRSYRAACRLT
jgi:SMODS-associated and fused to various effectors sensor domain